MIRKGLLFSLVVACSASIAKSSSQTEVLANKIHGALEKASKRLRPEASKTLGYHAYRKNQCLSDDLVVMEVERQNFLRVSRAIVRGEDSQIPSAWKNSVMNIKNLESLQLEDDLKLVKLEASEKKGGSFSDYLKSFSRISSLDIEVKDYAIVRQDRTDLGDPKRMNLLVEFDLRGFKGKQRVHDLLDINVEVMRSKETWSVQRLNFSKGHRVVINRPSAFGDISKKVGLDKVPVHLRREAIRRGGYSVALNDYNRDGVQDLFVGTGSNSVLYRGVSKKGELTSFKKTSSPLEKSTFVKSSVFADFDNDGDQDVVLIRFVDKEKINEQLVYYENRNGKLVENRSVFTEKGWNSRYAMPVAAGDFNQDSFLDFYVGFPGKDDFSKLSNGPGKHEPHGMFYNNKKNGFVSKNKEVFNSKVDHTVYPHSAIAVDYDQDQDSDLIIIDDRNNLSPILRNDGNKFYQQAEKIGLGNAGYGMSIATGDFNADGLIDFAMTNVVTRSDSRLVKSCRRNWSVNYALFSQERGLRIFQNLGNGRFSDVTSGSGLEWPGAATGGVVFFDYDNDGLEDIYVVNGLWSGNKKGQDFSTAWSHLRAVGYYNNTLKYSDRDTHSELMSLLIHYEGDLYKNRKTDGINPSFAGYQRNRLYKNLGDGKFVDVGFVENADRIEDGYAVVSTDLDLDGRRDLILRNADPGVNSNVFSPVIALQNKHAGETNFLAIRLSGKVSNKDAIGTEVVVKSKSGIQVKQLLANNGPQQDDRVLHFGLGNDQKVDVTIKWPNKQISIFKGVKPGFHHWEEPVKGDLVGRR